MSNKIPKHWINCPRFGERVEGSHFVPLKVPLGKKYDNVLWTDHQFSIASFINAQEKFGRRVVAIISLANKRDFYEHSDCNGVPFHFIQCRGHEVIPVEQFPTFCGVMSSISLGENDIVAIHCTHGFNRTGYMIIRYLVEQCAVSFTDAMRRFKEARSPGIYKPDYLAALYQQYQCGDPGPAPKHDFDYPGVNSLPTFYLAPGERIPYDSEKIIDGVNMGNPGKKLSTIEAMDLRIEVADMCGSSRDPSWFPGSQPISLSAENITNLDRNVTDYRATYKSDGVRYLCLCFDRVVYFINRNNDYYQVNLTLVDRQGEPLTKSLFDGELVEEEYNGTHSMSFLILDVVYFEELPLKDSTWDHRMDYVRDGLVAFYRKWRELTPERFASDDFDVTDKPQWPLNKLADLDRYIKESVRHETDGIIFTPLSMRYVLGRCNSILKWKPHTLNSVDFLAKYVDGVLYLTIPCAAIDKEDNDVAISILSGDQELLESINGVSLECVYDIPTESWKPLRIRTDKKTGNAYTTFIGVVNSIRDDITIEKLIARFENSN